MITYCVLQFVLCTFKTVFALEYGIISTSVFMTDIYGSPGIGIICNIRSPDSFTNIKHAWIFKDVPLAMNDELLSADSSRYKVSLATNINIHTYILVITNMLKTDAGTYMCHFEYWLDNDNGFTFRKPAHVNVDTYLPSLDYPQCTITPSTILDDGSFAIFRCIVGETTASITLSLMLQSSNGIVTYLGNDSVQRILSPSDNGTMFLCNMTSGTFPTVHRTCSSGPIIVLSSPSTTNEYSSNPITTSFLPTLLSRITSNDISTVMEEDSVVLTFTSVLYVIIIVLGTVIIILVIIIIICIFIKSKNNPQPLPNPPPPSHTSHIFLAPAEQETDPVPYAVSNFTHLSTEITRTSGQRNPMDQQQATTNQNNTDPVPYAESSFTLPSAVTHTYMPNQRDPNQINRSLVPTFKKATVPDLTNTNPASYESNIINPSPHITHTYMTGQRDLRLDAMDQCNRSSLRGHQSRREDTRITDEQPYAAINQSDESSDIEHTYMTQQDPEDDDFDEDSLYMDVIA